MSKERSSEVGVTQCVVLDPLLKTLFVGIQADVRRPVLDEPIGGRFRIVTSSLHVVGLQQLRQVLIVFSNVGQYRLVDVEFLCRAHSIHDNVPLSSHGLQVAFRTFARFHHCIQHINKNYRTSCGKMTYVGLLRPGFSAHLTLLERTLAVDICLSVCPSVRLSNACIVTKRHNSLSMCQHHTIH